MEIEKYINRNKNIYKIFLRFLENEEEEEEELLNLLDNHKIKQNQEELKLFLRLISKISRNHHRSAYFNDKIEKIILFLKEDIKQTYSNSQIFNFFKKDKRILLFLVQNDLMTIDDTVVKHIYKQRKPKLCHFFYPEIKNFMNEKKREFFEEELFQYDPNIFDNFEEKRKIGENENYLCSLIRTDSIVDFISHITRTNYPLSSEVKPSIFETNSFLLKNDQKVSLIEYAAFFGSSQIYQFLRLNNVILKPSLWLYSIHSNNAEMIHLLEESGIKPNDKTYEKCLEESIKCHHNDISNYFENNLIENEFKFNENIVSYSFHYNNYEHFPDDFLSNKFIFYYACQFDYLTLVRIYLKTRPNLNLNAKIVFL
ncbi:hypothetical protein M9Y10_007306 [Tritrichomonas musculus]|uniref:DUF3447 domain-containing protein n=1 Tax=Tritrichomonas musculus TaxID=1915356 RepID=A0ABR2J0Z3_9EUKA